MSLAFALMAAINGSRGSSATLSYGLLGTKPRRRQPGGREILNAQRWWRKPPETLTCESPALRPRSGSVDRAGGPAVDGVFVRLGQAGCSEDSVCSRVTV